MRSTKDTLMRRLKFRRRGKSQCSATIIWNSIWSRNGLHVRPRTALSWRTKIMTLGKCRACWLSSKSETPSTQCSYRVIWMRSKMLLNRRLTTLKKHRFSLRRRTRTSTPSSQSKLTRSIRGKTNWKKSSPPSQRRRTRPSRTIVRKSTSTRTRSAPTDRIWTLKRPSCTPRKRKWRIASTDWKSLKRNSTSRFPT